MGSHAEIHSTRLFPKGKGASEYKLSGIAKLCDWVVLTDLAEDRQCLRGNTGAQPGTVFLSMRSLFHAIPYFYNEILPRIESPFVLVSGSEDFTVPNQVDLRWRAFNTHERNIIDRLLGDERLIHWFIENRDENLPKTSSLPVGFVFEKEHMPTLAAKTPATSIHDRPLKVLCAHRVRTGRQWNVRRNLSLFCERNFKKYSTILTNELSISGYQHQVQQHPFVLCAAGGGVDPSPKAWFSIANGAIPVIKSSAVDDAYSQLPVVIIDEWDENYLNVDNLEKWRTQFARYYDDPVLRAAVLDKLSLNYWWDRIRSYN